MKRNSLFLLLVISITFLSCSKKPGSLTGNVYWKYNNYVGNKPDAGSKINLYLLEEDEKEIAYKTSADVQGNFHIEKIKPGRYLLVVRSNNTTDCPMDHLRNLEIHKEDIKQVFGLDLDNYKEQMQKISSLDSLIHKTYVEADNTSGEVTEHIKTRESLNNQINEIVNKVFESFTDDFKIKTGLLTSYSNSCSFSVITIKEDETTTEVIDFGLTCI